MAMAPAISEKDDLPHPVGDDPAWNESYYFFWADRASDLAGFCRIGVRSNSGYVESLNGVFLGGSRVCFAHQQRPIDDGGTGLYAGGLRFDCIEPMNRWQLRFNGEVEDLENGAILEIPSKERQDPWMIKRLLDMNLTFDVASPPHAFDIHGGQRHFEHFGAVHGTIQIDGIDAQISGFGIRDKSWGPRTWEPTRTGFPCDSGAPSTFIKWLVAPFGPDLAFATIINAQPDGTHRGLGLFLRHGRNHAIIDAIATSRYRPGSALHTHIQMRGRVDGESFEVKGEVINHIPTKIAMPGGATLITEGLVRWALPDGRHTLGIAEYHVTLKKRP
jgi:hypothetical protein